MTDLDDLIARIEAATEGSRELDGDIALYLAVVPEDAFRPSVAHNDAGVFATGAYTLWRAPYYTTSIDAAMTLVPEGWYVHDLSSCPNHDEWWAVLKQSKSPWLTVGQHDEDMGHRSAALALCAAALRARIGSRHDPRGI